MNPRRFVAENAPGDPACKLCRGAGTKGKANRLGLYKHCKCISETAKAAHAQRAAEYNERMKLLHSARPKLPKDRGP